MLFKNEPEFFLRLDALHLGRDLATDARVGDFARSVPQFRPSRGVVHGNASRIYAARESRLYAANKKCGKPQDSAVPAKAEQPYVIVARNISRLRNARGVTQEKLCELANVDRANFQRVEPGKQNMTLDHLDRVRKALGCRWADLFRGLDQPE